MSTARLVITAVVLEGRSQSDVARDYGMSQPWISRLIARYRAERGSLPATLTTPTHQSHTSARDTIDLIVELRAELASKGLDNGPSIIAWHLHHHHDLTVSAASKSQRQFSYRPEYRKTSRSQTREGLGPAAFE